MGVHENDQLMRLGLKVTPVVFSKDKDEFIGHVRWRLEKGLIKIPDSEIDSRFFTLIQQMKTYNYDPHGKLRKINNDCVDSMLCTMKPFIVAPRLRFCSLHQIFLRMLRMERTKLVTR